MSTVPNADPGEASVPLPAALPVPLRLRLARWISIVGHPFVLCLVLAGVSAVALTSITEALLIVALVGLGAVVPALWFLIREVRAGRTNFDVTVRQDRGRMYRLASILTVLLLVALYVFGAPREISAGVIAILVLLAVSALCNQHLKVSVHTAFATFVGVLLGAFNGWAAGIALATAFGIGWSRVTLERHTTAEVSGGAALGLLVAFALLFVLAHLGAVPVGAEGP